jgi:glyoxylase-like metal-dependent hydrolase (beta-lactamase superfamily II)
VRIQGIELGLLAAIWLGPSTSRAEDSRRLEVTEVAPGVHVAIRPRPLEHPVDGNVTVLVGKEEVIVVDSGRTPSSAREAIAEIRKITSLPVRYLVNTHWHGDHQHGNATYLEAFPGLQIVSQRTTREDIATLGASSLAGQIKNFSERGRLESYLASGVDGEGRALSPARKHRLRQLLAVPPSYLTELQSVRLTLPTLTFDRELRLYQGDREVLILSNGAGNTRGDAVVYLPREKIVITGDLLVSTVPFMSVSYPRGWLARLDEIAALDFDLIVPGHGPVQRDRSQLDLHRELLRSLVGQLDGAIRDGAGLDAAVARVDLSRFREAYSKGDAFLADEFDYRVTLNAPRDGYLEATSARASHLGAAVAAEASRLVALIPEDKRAGLLASELKATIPALSEIGGDVSSGRVYLALRKLSEYQETMVAGAFFYDNQPAASDPARFDALWNETGRELETGDITQRLAGKSAAVRGRAEVALNRVSPHYRASRLYAKAGQQEGGVYYLGSAVAALAFARFCIELPDEDSAGDPPELSGLAAIESEISGKTLQAYQREDAASVHHKDFIRIDSALKEARELLHDGRRYGAAASLLEARLRLGVANASPGMVPDFGAVSYEARLFDPRRDNSMARELWERALAGAASGEEEQRRIAAVILTDVIPFYFEKLSP